MKNKIQVLISTMNRENFDFLKNMNLQTEVVVGNQCGENKVFETDEEFGHIKVINSDTQGLSVNRNITLKYADADIVMLSDDDLEYVDDYKNIVSKAFEENPDADVIVFNLYEEPITRYVIKKKFKVGWFNYMRFGSVRISFRLDSIRSKNIVFDKNFGAGSSIPTGEDTIFLHDCLANKLNIYAVPVYLLRLTNERKSTWFSGYTDQYFQNKGKLFKRILPCFYKLLCLQDAVRHSKTYGNDSWIKYYKLMTKQ